MLLKIRDGNGWVMYDGVEKIRYDEVSPESYDDASDDSMINPSITGNIVVASFYRKGSDDQKTVAFNQEAYLCSDQGKTVERLTPRR